MIETNNKNDPFQALLITNYDGWPPFIFFILNQQPWILCQTFIFLFSWQPRTKCTARFSPLFYTKQQSCKKSLTISKSKWQCCLLWKIYKKVWKYFSEPWSWWSLDSLKLGWLIMIPHDNFRIRFFQPKPSL